MSFDNFDEPNPYAAPSTSSFTPVTNPSDKGLPLATRGERFIGALVDGLILLPVVFGVGVVLGILLVVAGLEPDSTEFNIIATVAGGFIGAAVFTAIHGFFLATRGQTVGKMLVKTKIVSEADDEMVPLPSLLLKRYLPIWIVTTIPVIGGLFGLANALAIFRENRKCVHDDIAGTKVVKLPS